MYLYCELFIAVEGYIIFASGIHEEAQEDQVYDLFSDFGNLKNLHVNLDRKSGYLKGYALVEYEGLAEAQKAINKLNGEDFMGKKLTVGFAFKKPQEIDQKEKG